MKITSIIYLFVLPALASCGKPEPRSKQYFDAHLDEARKIVAGCRDGTVTGGECDNADFAVQEADARERGARFFKIKPHG